MFGNLETLKFRDFGYCHKFTVEYYSDHSHHNSWNCSIIKDTIKVKSILKSINEQLARFPQNQTDTVGVSC